MTTYVYLKLQSNTDNSDTINVIPLKANSVSISVSKTIPSFPVPLSGVATGESITAALDLGMAQKTISVQGVILDEMISKTIDNETVSRKFTAHEIAQMIASGVDSTGFAKNQAINELIVKIPSLVASDYNYIGTCSNSAYFNKTDCEANGGTWTVTVDDNSTRENGRNIPFTFASRGDNDELDNLGVPAKISSFPDKDTDTGLTGFIRSFSCDISGETYELSFSLEFETAVIVP
jgi:hypothetical protein|tara:strand:+ start:273 stop:977 length:705 start_codon:yes stop_codon:yes gene_type:complete